MVCNARCDVLAYSRGYFWLMGDMDPIPFGERNLLVQSLLHPEWRERIVVWADHVPRIVAGFRAGWAEHVSEPAWKSLVKRLTGESPMYDQLWNRFYVTREPVSTRRFEHQLRGRSST
jgi:hypothetical protein